MMSILLLPSRPALLFLLFSLASTITSVVSAGSRPTFSRIPLSAYIPVPPTTTRTPSQPTTDGATSLGSAIDARTTTAVVNRKEARPQQQAASFVSKAAALAEMPSQLQPPTSRCVKAQFVEESSSSSRGGLASGGKVMTAAAATQQKEAADSELDDEDSQAQSLHVKHIKNSGKYPVLVVNADCQPLSYLPLSVMRWQDAIKAIFLERVVVLERYDVYIQSTRAKVQLPSVICLKGYVKRHKETKTPSLNRRNVFIRDQYRCQYCAVQMKSSELTLDHVIPKSKGGKGSWENLVTACSACNRKKGRKSLKEVKAIGMQLLRPPKKPTTAEIQSVARSFKVKSFVHDTWKTYLGY